MNQPAIAPGYWQETRLPIYTGLIVLPFVIVYELGLICLKLDVINGGDAILLDLGGPLLQLIGVGAGFASMAVLGVCYLVWHAQTGCSWSFRTSYVVAMFLESLLYAVVLFLILGFAVQYLPRNAPADPPPQKKPARESSRPAEQPARRNAPQQNAPTRSGSHGTPGAHGTHGTHTPSGPARHSVTSPAPAPMLVSQPSAASTAARNAWQPGIHDFVLYCGAGVYEEFVFRVLLLGLLMLVFTKLLHMEHAYAAVWSVVLGAIIFSAFHHIGGERFGWSVFIQRAFAGLYFAAIYVNRNFGVAASSHALYDILVGLNYLRD